MMLELNSKPKKLIVQRHSKSNNWLTEAVMVKSEEDDDNRRWTVDEVYYLLETFQIPCDESYGDLETVPVRILNEHGKVILSTASHDFLIEAGRSGHITVREPIETEGGETAYKMECYSAKNDAYPHIREFQRFIGRHKGISHVTKYPRNEYDGWEQVWKVYFKDKTFVTVGTHHLYESGGMIISHFAKDRIGY
jgi:hypothetical protein